MVKVIRNPLTEEKIVHGTLFVVQHTDVSCTAYDRSQVIPDDTETLFLTVGPIERSLITRFELSTNYRHMEIRLYWEGPLAAFLMTLPDVDGGEEVALTPSNLHVLGGESQFWKEFLYSEADDEYAMWLKCPFKVKSYFSARAYHTSGINQNAAFHIRYDEL